MTRGMQDAEEQRILIVDDARENVRILSAILKDTAKLSFALGGQDALAKVHSAPIDLILLDIEMPDLDGYAVLRALKSNPETAAVPVIFVTGRSSEENEAEGLRLGAIDYITKPYNPAIVLARVRNQLLLRSYARNLEALNAELERLATSDPLTGIANRRAFRDRANAEIRRLGRYGGTDVLMMLDIDHFKRVNDTHGHDAGDEVLRQFTARVSGCLRATDLFGRLGGEEFGILALESDMQSGAVLANRLLQAVRGSPVPWNGQEIAMTVSVGLSEVRGAETSIDALIARADEALYRAKRSGRNRVDFATSGD